MMISNSVLNRCLQNITEITRFVLKSMQELCFFSSHMVFQVSKKKKYVLSLNKSTSITYGLHNLQSSCATFSQFFFEAQKTKHDLFGIISVTRPPTISGSILSNDSEYCNFYFKIDILEEIK